MLCNYGYADSTGTYYIQIDTDACIGCTKRPCLHICPGNVYELVENDWEERVAAVRENVRNQLKAICSECKSDDAKGIIPACIRFCESGGITHSW